MLRLFLILSTCLLVSTAYGDREKKARASCFWLIRKVLSAGDTSVPPNLKFVELYRTNPDEFLRQAGDDPSKYVNAAQKNAHIAKLLLQLTEKEFDRVGANKSPELVEVEGKHHHALLISTQGDHFLNVLANFAAETFDGMKLYYSPSGIIEAGSNAFYYDKAHAYFVQVDRAFRNGYIRTDIHEILHGMFKLAEKMGKITPLTSSFKNKNGGKGYEGEFTFEEMINHLVDARIEVLLQTRPTGASPNFALVDHRIYNAERILRHGKAVAKKLLEAQEFETVNVTLAHDSKVPDGYRVSVEFENEEKFDILVQSPKIAALLSEQSTKFGGGRNYNVKDLVAHHSKIEKQAFDEGKAYVRPMLQLIDDALADFEKVKSDWEDCKKKPSGITPSDLYRIQRKLRETQQVFEPIYPQFPELKP